MSKLNLDDHLTTALMEALREDWEQELKSEEAPRMSWRQRRRLKRMLADPKGYCRRYLRDKEEPSQNGVIASPGEVRVRRRHMTRAVMAAAAAALLGGSALAYSLTGGVFITRVFDFFGQELGLDADVADMSQLAKTDGAALGTILETDELRVELLDAVSGGYMSMTALRVTCKQLDTVLEKDENGDVLWQAMFGDTEGSITDNATVYGSSYQYTGEKLGLELASNQFCLIFNTNSTETIKAGIYTLELHNLVKSSWDTEDTVLYTGDWTLNIPLEDGANYARTALVGETYSISGTEYLLERVQYSPLSINLYFSSETPAEDRFDFTDYSVMLKDGRVLDGPWLFCGVGSGSDASGSSAQVTLEFNAPLNVDQIASVQFCGYSLELAAAN
ncbi:hypothetical protein [Oscillibacter sp. GMB15532]|uniref:hypothetical protein n=1 Tax=Oscillibacter sp. GMB15532 TaxID=3230022 RepID=UPI0034DEECB2